MRNTTVIGAILGDIIGSVYEFEPINSKNFDLFSAESRFTDDSIMTLAVAKAVMDSDNDFSNLSDRAVYWMQKIGATHRGDYGQSFRKWLAAENPQPYNSWGNGAAMRVSPVACAARSIEEVKILSKKVTEVTHNHPEGIKGAEAIAVAVFLALQKKSKAEIKEYIEKNYYKLDRTLEEIACDYKFDESCQGTVPEAIQCFLEGKDFEDVIRNCVWLGGDADTMGAIAGAIAGSYFEIDSAYIEKAMGKLTAEYRSIYEEWTGYLSKRS